MKVLLQLLVKSRFKLLVFAHSGPFEGMGALQAFSAN